MTRTSARLQQSNYKDKLRNQDNVPTQTLSSSSNFRSNSLNASSMNNNGYSRITRSKTNTAPCKSKTTVQVVSKTIKKTNKTKKSVTKPSNTKKERFTGLLPVQLNMRENILQPPQIAPNLLPRYKRKYEGNINNCSGLTDSIMTMNYQQQDRYKTIKPLTDIQFDITWGMREILIDWLVDVSRVMKFSAQTIFLTVSLIDRSMQKIIIKRSSLQLIGIASLSIACKIEEIKIPYPGDFTHITDNAYTRQELLDMECSILQGIGYEVIVPTAVHFLCHYMEKLFLSDQSCALALYYLERNLQDQVYTEYTPSQLAAAAIYAVLTQRSQYTQIVCNTLCYEATMKYMKQLRYDAQYSAFLLTVDAYERAHKLPSTSGKYLHTVPLHYAAATECVKYITDSSIPLEDPPLKEQQQLQDVQMPPTDDISVHSDDSIINLDSSLSGIRDSEPTASKEAFICTDPQEQHALHSTSNPCIELWKLPLTITSPLPALLNIEITLPITVKKYKYALHRLQCDGPGYVKQELEAIKSMLPLQKETVCKQQLQANVNILVQQEFKYLKNDTTSTIISGNDSSSSCSSDDNESSYLSIIQSLAVKMIANVAAPPRATTSSVLQAVRRKYSTRVQEHLQVATLPLPLILPPTTEVVKQVVPSTSDIDHTTSASNSSSSNSSSSLPVNNNSQDVTVETKASIAIPTGTTTTTTTATTASAVVSVQTHVSTEQHVHTPHFSRRRKRASAIPPSSSCSSSQRKRLRTVSTTDTTTATGTTTTDEEEYWTSTNTSNSSNGSSSSNVPDSARLLRRSSRLSLNSSSSSSSNTTKA